MSGFIPESVLNIFIELAHKETEEFRRQKEENKDISIYVDKKGDRIDVWIHPTHSNKGHIVLTFCRPSWDDSDWIDKPLFPLTEKCVRHSIPYCCYKLYFALMALLINCLDDNQYSFFILQIEIDELKIDIHSPNKSGKKSTIDALNQFSWRSEHTNNNNHESIGGDR